MNKIYSFIKKYQFSYRVLITGILFGPPCSLRTMKAVGQVVTELYLSYLSFNISRQRKQMRSFHCNKHFVVPVHNYIFIHDFRVTHTCKQQSTTLK